MMASFSGRKVLRKRPPSIWKIVSLEKPATTSIDSLGMWTRDLSRRSKLSIALRISRDACSYPCLRVRM